MNDKSIEAAVVQNAELDKFTQSCDNCFYIGV